MAARFREVTPNSGVDEDLNASYQGIVVPLKGSNRVFLEDGAGLKVKVNVPTLVKLRELTTKPPHDLTATQTAGLKNKTLRLFEIAAHVVPGMDKAFVTAVDSKGDPQAKLKVLVLRPRVASISIRKLFVPDGTREVALSKDQTSAQALLKIMNDIWTPQANVIFKLESSENAKIKVLSPQATGVDITRDDILKELVAAKGDTPGLTVFMVNQALDNRKVVNGVTHSKAGVALISDKRRESTLAHEAGHYLGAVDQKGRHTGNYGHPGSQAEHILMRDEGSGRKIPYSVVVDFNKGYTSK